MNRQDIDNIISQIEKEDSIFAKKASLDSLSLPSNILGRKKQAEQLIRYLLGYKQGYVVPYISIYGRSGAGKSSVVRFVCGNIDDISFRFVNLRQAKTVFGAANLVLAELGVAGLKNAQGINLAVDTMGQEIASIMQNDGRKLFVLILDELDVIFHDKRGKPSDFVYKIMVLAEKLREKGLLLCVIGISNNVLSEYGLDDRVRSRIGSSEIFFEPYSKSDVLSILKERAEEAFAKKISDDVLEYCADMASKEHGDARRSIDLLRVAAEIASEKGEDLLKKHVDMAQEMLQQDRIKSVISSASYHLRVACASLVNLAFVSGEDWHTTSDIYEKYCEMLAKDTKPLGYRRVSELLTDLENTGLVVSSTISKGRHGYGTQYKLKVSPEMAGLAISEEWWKGIVKNKIEKEEHDALFKNIEQMQKRTGRSSFYPKVQALDSRLAKLKKKYNIS